jgi:membrane associated rhomboid family serine protease
MARLGSVQFAFPDFSGATRRLVLLNLVAFFALLLLTMSRIVDPMVVLSHFGLYPPNFLAGFLWQPLTYSFVHLSLIGTLFELLSIWFLAGFLQSMHSSRWIDGLYAVSVLGAALVAVLVFVLGLRFGMPPPLVAVTGSLGGIFGLLTAIALLHGDVQFQMFFVIGIKAKYLAVIYTLIAIAETFGEQRIYAFAQLGGALGAILYVRFGPQRGFGFAFTESLYALRNRYFRWKRRRAAGKFQVYMKKHGRTVRFDGQGRLIDEDDARHDDRKRWN